MDQIEQRVRLLEEIADELEALVVRIDDARRSERRPWTDSTVSAHQRRASNLVDEGLYLVASGGEVVSRGGSRAARRAAPRRRR